MKHLYLKCIALVAACLLASMSGWALEYESFIKDGIGYKILSLDDKTVAVTNRAQIYVPPSAGSRRNASRKKAYQYQDVIYSGHVVIPATVRHDGITYTVTSIFPYTFRQSGIIGITIPYTVTDLGNNQFSGTNIKTVIIEDGDTELDCRQFYDYYSQIETLYLGRNVKHDSGHNGPYFGKSLKTLTIGDRVTILQANMFRDNVNLTTVHFGANVASMGMQVFSSCTSLASIDLTSKLTEIPQSTFYGCTALQSVTLPQGLTTIGQYAFRNCSSLQSISFPESLITIGMCSFEGTGLTRIDIPASLTSIERAAFNSCLQLKDVIIEDGDTELGITGVNGSGDEHYAFAWSPIDSMYIGRNLVQLERTQYPGFYKPTLRALAFGDKVTKCGSWRDFTNLTSVYFGKNISTPSEYMFSGCTSLKHIDMTSKLKAVYYRTFYNCTALESVILPQGATYLGGKLFEGCTSLESISIPGKVTEIGYYAFDGCTSLKDVVFEDGEGELVLEKYSATSFFNKCPIDSVYLGRELMVKPHNNDSGYPVYDFYPLFPESLTKLTIGSSVSKEWDSKTFQNCTGLTHIYPLWEEPITTNKNMFPNATYANATLLVPGGTVKKYQATEAWKYFSNIVPTSIGVTMTATEGGSIRLGDEVVSGGTKLIQVKPNSVLTFEIAAKDEYYLESVVMNEVDVTSQLVDGKFTPTDLSEDIELTATFKAKPYYTVTATASEGGTAVVESESVMMGRSTTVTFTADEGHELVSVTVNDEDKTSEVVNGVLTLDDIKEDLVIVATFQKFRYTITATECENGSISLSASEVEWGDDVTITLVPDLHCETASVSVNAEDKTTELIDNQLTIHDVRQALTIDATFRLQTFAVTANCNEGGSVSLSSETAQWGSSVTVTVEPDDEHFLESVTVNGVEVIADMIDGQYTIPSVECDMDILVTFVPKPYFNVTATASAGGTATVESNSVMWGCSTNVMLTVNEGYELVSVTVNGEDRTSDVVDGVLTLNNITEDTDVVVTFQKLKFMVTAYDCENGSISLSALKVEWGDDVTVTVIPDNEYELASLFVNGEDVTAKVIGNKYVIRNIRDNIEISATFSPTFAMIELTADGESTYCCDHDLDFSRNLDISAYIASGYYPQTGYVLLVRVLEVPAGTGIILRGLAGTYKVPFGESSAYYLNLLVGNVEPTTVEPTDGSYFNLYLTDGDDGPVFQRITSPLEMDANSAYLQLPARIVGGESNVKIAYEEDADAVRAAIGTTDDAVYDIQGRKLAAPRRGMNIIRMSDGTTRKVMVK